MGLRESEGRLIIGSGPEDMGGVAPVPDWRGRETPYGSVAIGSIFNIYYAYSICVRYTKVEPQGEGAEKWNAELCGDGDLRTPKKRWFEELDVVYTTFRW